MFCGDRQNRGKFNCILAEELKPANGQEATFDYLDVDNFQDRGDNENEVKQIIADITSVHLLEGETCPL